MATYYADRYAVGGCSLTHLWYDYDTFREDLRSTDRTTVLANASTWTAQADYEKGEAVLAALDWRIRRTTNREATLETVIRRLNPHVYISQDRLEATVRNVSSPETARWLHRHTTTDAAPNGTRLPEAPGRFGFDAAPECGPDPTQSDWSGPLGGIGRAIEDGISGTPLADVLGRLATILPLKLLRGAFPVTVGLVGLCLLVASPVLAVLFGLKLSRSLRRVSAWLR
jgi:hypothetical protein